MKARRFMAVYSSSHVPWYPTHTDWMLTDVTGYPGRNFNRLYVPQVRTNYGRQSLYFRGSIYGITYLHCCILLAA